MNRRFILLGICLTSIYTAIQATGQAPTPSAQAATAKDNAAAWILLYHHVSQDTPASTSVIPDTFE